MTLLNKYESKVLKDFSLQEHEKDEFFYQRLAYELATRLTDKIINEAQREKV